MTSAEGWRPTDSCLSMRSDEPYLDFNGDGHRTARKLLCDHVKDQRKLSKALVRIRISLPTGGMRNGRP